MRTSSIHRLALITAVTLLIILPPATTLAAPTPPIWGFEQAIYATSPQSAAHFGQSVAVSGDTIVVGEADRTSTPPIGGVPVRSGAAYVYVRTDGVWTLQQELQPPAMQEGARFGAAVAIDGDTIVVGAPGYRVGGVQTGAAFAFTRNAGVWSGATHLTSPDAVANAEVGASVAVEKATALVGAPRDSAHATATAGTARPYAYSLGSWSQQGTLHDPNAIVGDNFGGSVALSGSSLFVGATLDAYPSTGFPSVMSCGSVQHFVWTSVAGWQLAQTIYEPTPGAGEQFGGPIAVAGDHLFASAWQGTMAGRLGAGRVQVYAWDGATWIHETTLAAPAPSAYDYFGSGVDAEGDRAVIGAFFSNGYRGRAYFYSHEGGTWAQTQQVDMSGFVPNVTQLGTSVGLSGSSAVLGGQMSTAPGSGVGAGGAYVFTTPVSLWGVVTDASTGLPVPGIEVSMYMPDAYGEPELKLLGFTDPDGVYAFSLPAGDYRLGWMDGNDIYYAGFYNEVTLFSQAATVTVPSMDKHRIDLAIHKKPAAWFSALSARASVRRYRAFTVSGQLKPRHRPGTSPVTIECYRWNGSAWILRRAVRTRAANFRTRRSLPYWTRFTASLSLPTTGRWRIRAVHAADGTYRASASRWHYITVR